MEALARSNSWTIASVHPPLGEKQTDRITGVSGGGEGWDGAAVHAARMTIRIRDRRFIERDYNTSEYPFKWKGRKVSSPPILFGN